MINLRTSSGETLITTEQAQILEWLESDGLGGFASGTVSSIRTRRYHALLLNATRPPIGRLSLIPGFDAILEFSDQSFLFSTQAYGEGQLGGAGLNFLTSFSTEPWPTWTFQWPERGKLIQEIFVPHGSPSIVLRWKWISDSLIQPKWLHIRPFFSGRDFHALVHENADFNFSSEEKRSQQTWRFYPQLPEVHALSNGTYHAENQWYRHFFYAEEQARGFDATEDLASPGEYHFEFAHSPQPTLIFSTAPFASGEAQADSLAHAWAEAETNRRAHFPTPAHRSADAYIVQRGEGLSLIAGYPWFEDWGRDTFISMRGLCLATGRLEVAEKILSAWAGQVSEGMLPNRFPDASAEPEFNSVDASLWYVVVVHEFLQAAEKAQDATLLLSRSRLLNATEEILTRYHQGTRFGIRLDEDALLSCGVPGQQLTWMDAKIDDWVVTPRIGKPVEVQALWINALRLASRYNSAWGAVARRAEFSFQHKFWDSHLGYLYDVVDLNHQPGQVCRQLRPNQIFAVGGLPYSLLSGEKAEKVLHLVEEKLCTPLGLRSLSPDDPDYQSHYTGSPRERDGAYHQGTVWPWLAGAFIEAWVRLHGSTPSAKAEARKKFLTPALERTDFIGLNHLPEIADATHPYAARGCPFQAWSLGERLRLELTILI